MLPHVGWGEMMVLLVVGLLVFGPERLPKVIGDAGRMLRQVRQMARTAATELKSELGPEMADLDLRSLHPRTIFEDAMRDDTAPAPVDVTGVGNDATAANSVGREGAPVGLALHERPPYDPDAT